MLNTTEAVAEFKANLEKLMKPCLKIESKKISGAECLPSMYRALSSNPHAKQPNKLNKYHKMEAFTELFWQLNWRKVYTSIVYCPAMVDDVGM